MVTLAIATAPDEFCGWGGVGPCVSNGVGAAPSHGSWSHSNINMSTTTPNASGFGRGCLWLPFTEKSSTVSLLVNVEWSTTAAFTPGDTTLSMVAVGLYGDGNSAIVMAANGTANTYDIYLATDYTDWSTYTALGVTISPVNMWTYLCITITGGGTANGSVDVSWGPATGGYELSITAEASWTGDLTGFKNFSAVSLHNPCTGSSTYSIAGVVADTKSLKGGGLWTYIPNTIGTLNEWINTGWTTAFGEFPTMAGTYTNGLYATATGQLVTFAAAGNPSSALPTGYGVRTMGVHVFSLSTDMTADTTLVPITYDPADGVVTRLSGPLPAASQNGIPELTRWYMETDLKTGDDWVMADVARYQFGLERVT